ncbi:hypothetical protein LY76DRAFT_353804 [Colletotrichum caudatum]|nr:hypothetical protein LY76DRAFT_353804 [Colletotrichum caudatum]
MLLLLLPSLLSSRHYKARAKYLDSTILPLAAISKAVRGMTVLPDRHHGCSKAFFPLDTFCGPCDRRGGSWYARTRTGDTTYKVVQTGALNPMSRLSTILMVGQRTGRPTYQRRAGLPLPTAFCCY